ncbi:PLD nuclease N-terminal domain-containing protein [Arcanobacterium pinnipediorum]|uniref:PLD nuclease N-terminal domain-containing protein n=1 Tax=Arcanobacterium pinnipediorum TaxID=1503041 RepID=A0ABY5AI21_9ACTO|nr:PLD nuclease N-terminal domain-containing protein [Arcanobacterium pinnipediorum]USR79641.1 PLD nuclease N-terminal domain-containing protein [Arcanobacterium pinnipediorum]
MARVLIVLTVLALHIYTFIDVARTDKSRLPGRLPKAAWLVVTLIVPILGPLLWLFLKNQHVLRSGSTLSSDSLKKPFAQRGKQPSGPVAPDDDPDFLARLEAQNRRRAYEQQKRAENGIAEEAPEDLGANDLDEPEEDGGLYGRRG